MTDMLVFGVPGYINAVAVGYHMNQQNIVPDCAYYTVDKDNPFNLPPNTTTGAAELAQIPDGWK